MKDRRIDEGLHRAENTLCDDCGSEMKVVGREFMRDEVVYVPPRIIRRRHYAEVQKCTNCTPDENSSGTKSDSPSVPTMICFLPHRHRLCQWTEFILHTPFSAVFLLFLLTLFLFGRYEKKAPDRSRMPFHTYSDFVTISPVHVLMPPNS